MSVGKALSWRQVLSVEERGDTVVVEGVELDPGFFEEVAKWLDSVESRYVDDVVKNVVGIVSRSLKELQAHNPEEFVPFGDYKVFDSIAKQLKDEFGDPYFKPRPHMVVLYGPPGTGKTTWARQVARKYLFEDGVLKGLYLEVSIGDMLSKWMGVPVHTAKAVLEGIKTDKYMSVALIDEADTVLVRPEGVLSGADLEQLHLVGELKSQLSFITSQYYPVLLVLTTNYKDAIVRADAALADRVTAWVEVPPPPLEVKERIVAGGLRSIVKTLLGLSTPLGSLAYYRAAWYNSPWFKVTEASKKLGYKFRWVVPIFPYSADYLVALLSAWGWNPLDPSIKLDYNHREALRVWSADNPIYRVYARAAVTLIEMYRRFNEDKKLPKSFLRAYAVLKRGFEDTARLHAKVYVEVLDILPKLERAVEIGDYEKARVLVRKLVELGFAQVDERTDPGSAARNLRGWLKGAYVDSLCTHPVHPTVLFLSMARQAVSKEFSTMVNNALGLAAPIALGIRYAVGQELLVSPLDMDDVVDLIATLRFRLDYYNRRVVEELKSGAVLEPLRIVYTDSSGEAWKKAVEKASKLPVELQLPLKLALLPLRVLHPVIHAETEEEKANRLYDLVKDEARLESLLWRTAEELEIEDFIYSLSNFDGIVDGAMRAEWLNHTFIETTAYPAAEGIIEVFKKNSYMPLGPVEGHIPVIARLYMRSREIVLKKYGNILQAS